MTISKEITTKIDALYLKILVDALTTGQLTLDEISDKTRQFLSLKPWQTMEEMNQKLKHFTTQSPIFSSLYLQFLAYKEEIQIQSQLSTIRKQLS